MQFTALKFEMWFTFNRWKNNKLLVLSNIIAKDQFPLTTDLDEPDQLLHKALFILTKATTIKILSTYCAKTYSMYMQYLDLSTKQF